MKTKTAGKDWFDLPAPAEADLPRLHREYEALRLRNHLDPKRFYRKDEREGKGIKGLPKYFAVRNDSSNQPVRLPRPLSRLGQSCQQRHPSANRRALTSHGQSVSVRWLRSFYTTRRRRVTQRRSSSRCRRFGGQTAGGNMQKRRQACDQSGDLSMVLQASSFIDLSLAVVCISFRLGLWVSLSVMLRARSQSIHQISSTYIYGNSIGYSRFIDYLNNYTWTSSSIMASPDPAHAQGVNADDTFELYDLRVEVICPPNERIFCGAKDGDYFILEGETLRLPPGQGISIYALSTDSTASSQVVWV